ncbi:MAG TPA: T9SS type A sorting domain-containing protein, partial [Bacteroidia bacterium]|nr:T9SS type A sorting domain-containing protein [Bacteroidia bacterium]
MNTKQKIIAALLVCGGQACIGQVIAPEVFASAGNNFSNSQGSLSWTLGEPIITTENSSTNYLTQGFQQPATIFVTAISNPTNQGNLNVYPNPVSSIVYIQRDGDKQLQIQLLDMNGKVVINKTLSPSENQLDL